MHFSPYNAIIMTLLKKQCHKCGHAAGFCAANAESMQEHTYNLTTMNAAYGDDTLNHKLKDEPTDRLFEAILALGSVEECYNFFEDLGTIAEIKAFAQRFEVAGMLMEKKTYREIHEKTGASEATISRVNKCLYYGADGYKLMLERLKSDKG